MNTKNYIAAFFLVTSCANPYSDLLGISCADDYIEEWKSWWCSASECRTDMTAKECEDLVDDGWAQALDLYGGLACIDAQHAANCIDLMNEYPRADNCMELLDECYWYSIVRSCEQE